jgi:hypothetical protein
VDDVLRAQTVALGDARRARGAAAEERAFALQLRPRGIVYRAVDAAASDQRAVRSVDDRVGVLLDDVAANELDAVPSGVQATRLSGSNTQSSRK